MTRSMKKESRNGISDVRYFLVWKLEKEEEKMGNGPSLSEVMQRTGSPICSEVDLMATGDAIFLESVILPVGKVMSGRVRMYFTSKMYSVIILKHWFGNVHLI